MKQEASAVPSWLSQVGSSVLFSAETQETWPLLNKRPVLFPAGFLKLGALSSLLLKPKRHSLHLTRGQCCSPLAFSSWELCPLFCWSPRDTASIKQEANAAAPCWLSQVGSSVLSSAEAQETRPPLYKRPVLLPTGFLKLGALSSLLLKPKRHGLR